MGVISKKPASSQYIELVDSVLPEEFFLKGREIFDIREFCHTTGLYHHLSLFKLLDIEPDSLVGDFSAERLIELENFCKRNQDFHIVSNIGPGILVNSGLRNAINYSLGDGDKDPWIYYVCD